MLKKNISAFIILTLLGALILGTIYLVNNYVIENVKTDSDSDKIIPPKKIEKPPEEVINPVLKEKCELLNGTYVPTVNECEYLSPESCSSLNGEYNECASACRNNPDSRICTMNCVPLCRL